MWTCPKCQTKVDPSFEVCWSCGTSADGVEDPTFVQADESSADASPLDLDMPEGDRPIPEPSSPLAGELVEAYWALDLMQAKFLADRLSEDGINAVADTHDMHDALGSMSSGPRVWVRAEDLPRAKAWLEAYDAQYNAEHGGAEAN
ncbi:putative signal transducing protein [Singulisphaera sp. PoT]|uniref:putative signal transducing protein n=1 Tax=Singulisphaera sp. PoT TaxID=3411797 RepID=UPI003BF4980C